MWFYTGLLPLHYVKDIIISHCGYVPLHGIIGTVPYGNAPHNTLQS